MATPASGTFVGLVSKRTYGVCDAIEPIGGAHYGTISELVFRFSGVPLATANSLSGSATYGDTNGSYTVSFDPAMTYDNSHLDYPHMKHSNAVTVTRTSPHYCDVEVVQQDHS